MKSTVLFLIAIVGLFQLGSRKVAGSGTGSKKDPEVPEVPVYRIKLEHENCEPCKHFQDNDYPQFFKCDKEPGGPLGFPHYCRCELAEVDTRPKDHGHESEKAEKGGRARKKKPPGDEARGPQEPSGPRVPVWKIWGNPDTKTCISSLLGPCGEDHSKQVKITCGDKDGNEAGLVCEKGTCLRKDGIKIGEKGRCELSIHCKAGFICAKDIRKCVRGKNLKHKEVCTATEECQENFECFSSVECDNEYGSIKRCCSKTGADPYKRPERSASDGLSFQQIPVIIAVSMLYNIQQLF